MNPKTQLFFQYIIIVVDLGLIAYNFHQQKEFNRAFFASSIFPAMLIIIAVGVIREIRKKQKNENRRV